MGKPGSVHSVLFGSFCLDLGVSDGYPNKLGVYPT